MFDEVEHLLSHATGCGNADMRPDRRDSIPTERIPTEWRVARGVDATGRCGLSSNFGHETVVELPLKLRFCFMKRS